MIIKRGRIAVEESLESLTAAGSLEEVFLRYITSDEAVAMPSDADREVSP